ncbi:MAG: sialidase family protein [Limisphaerales bacterium]
MLHSVRIAFVLLCALCNQPASSAIPGAGGWRHEELRRFKATEANQGVAVDAEFFYVNDNHTLGKYRKDTGTRVAGWDGGKGGRIQHLNAGGVIGGRLYCAHSNFPKRPEESSVEIWDTATMQPVGAQRFEQPPGSLTWAVPLPESADKRFPATAGGWLACFAHYKSTSDPARSVVQRFDASWKLLASWSFPAELIQRFAGSSASGGEFGPGGNLFVTGHDAKELYVLGFPATGAVLEWTATIPISAEGQAFAWDPVETNLLYSISRPRREVIVSRVTQVADATPAKILPADWDAKAAGDRVLAGLVKVTLPEVKGAHDAEMALVNGRAYIVAEANDVKAGEAPSWPYIYATLAVVNLKSLTVETNLLVAKGGQAFANETLLPGACFVPRALRRDDRTLRCFFASEEPGKRQSQIWFRDFDLQRGAFADTIHRAKLKTAAGTFDLQPKPFFEDAVKHGFKRDAKDYGLYLFDPIKVFDGKHYVGMNNYAAGQNALATLNAAMDTFEIVGHFNEPPELKLTEAAINRLPDGTWMAICRQEAGNQNYTFTTSHDGVSWTTNAHRSFVTNGAASRPTFDRFNGIYYLGWQERARIAGVNRSIFTLDVSRDGANWERKYRFETVKSFQYPTFREHAGVIYVSVTQGDSDPSRKERIMFGRLE